MSFSIYKKLHLFPFLALNEIMGSSQQRYRKSHRDWGIDLIYHAFCWFFTPRFD